MKKTVIGISMLAIFAASCGSQGNESMDEMDHGAESEMSHDMEAMETNMMDMETDMMMDMEPPKVQYSKIIERSADDLWMVVKQMDKIDKYSSAIASVEWKGEMGKGGERICHTPDGKGFFKEQIVAYDDNARSFSYSLLEGAPVKGMTNTMKVVDLGFEKSVLMWWSNYDEFIINDQMTEEQFHAFMLNSLEEMAVNMEADA